MPTANSTRGRSMTAIAIATGTSASQFDVAISTLRDAARSGDKARLLREVGLPLLYIDGDGKRREIKDRTEVEDLNTVPEYSFKILDPDGNVIDITSNREEWNGVSLPD